MRFGKIPTRITTVCAAPQLFKCGWEDVDVSIAEDRKVIACFAADADSKEAVASGRTWAENYNKGMRQPDVAVVEQIEDNSPRRLTLIGLERRQEGGRAFKVIDQSLRLFDLREDVLLETNMSVGVTKGGALNGEFIFARVGTQLRLIRVGSTLHAEMLKGEQRRASSNVNENDLVVGGLYANRKGLLIYFGRIDTIEEIYKGFGSHYNPFTALAASEHKRLLASSENDVAKPVSVIGEHMSVQLSKYHAAEPERSLEHALINAASYHTFTFGKSITAVELVRQLQVPENIIERFRMRALEYLDQMLTSMSHPKYVDGFGDQIPMMKRNRVRDVSAMANIRVHGQGANLSSEYLALFQQCDAPLS